ncbi:tRNA epoxyqueuosine(34) reductase QueG [Rhizobium leguminosarum bv. trifolii]|jgi:epoxyqueuosine reductase|uniref:tRNA epoxyqueuosine(34) reductase QueG n=1 Tax=Rhizobium ruizarguesonis TaxID=2081791 RepID=UPI0003F69BCD|nr:tRNA epoxyqueuosine(34) reductase QueG [Rhizobium ruizarguesonis]MBY5806807.1 tRNA epoxyqueuosine(34) reductase QueG [Rhizobium leguminosarum]NKL14992.1 tRNA epoxyqueuosine(34) reductase QueG [Rhizobium leguminosarum bv. viciae]QIO45389.1 tRNA epoxyqueuosine(34) reductase QueG [Rhizobium leguminosarum bv. trifolii]MBY5847036.1 tRNA epoxyqueuosine(34) reductase QueG [Rhizobium leguminosarum]NEH87140.1 tRNA epoxyqueuosine(34) reductase QueG [Rhizobium ruizarguesonis]
MPEPDNDDKERRRRDNLTEFVRAESAAKGFDLCRITRPDAIPQAKERLGQFIDAGRHGTMDWMAETRDRRGDPSTLWSEVRSVVVFGLNYAPEEDPRAILDKPDKAAISVYARNRDYHDVIKGRLKEIATRFAARAGADVKVFVDTAPVMEKPLAEAAGLGWQGKHTNLVSRTHGSWLFLGTMFTTADLVIDEAETDHCGSCRACLDICPTDAFPAPYQIDARRCISYLTIEHKGPIDADLRVLFGNRIYGCDDCLAACPWNKFASSASEMKLKAREDLKEPSIAFLLTLDDAAFRTFFSGSPVKRIGRDRFIRNVLIAAGNSGDKALIGPCRRLSDDPSPVVRGMAVWALSRLMEAGEFAAFAAQRADERDDDVLNEWRLAGVG